MKKIKICLVFCLTLLLLLFAACGGRESGDPYTDIVEYQGKTYVIQYKPNSTTGTITVEGMVCEFRVSGSANRTEFEVTYPNGSLYSHTDLGYGWAGGMSDNYDPPAYAEGDVLWDVLGMESPEEKQSRSGPIFLGLLVAGLGMVDVIWPQFGWYLSHGWRYKNAEPSEAALFFGRLGGIVVVIFGLGMMFFA